MPDVLEFNPNRDLAFNPNRDRLFDPERNLLFDPQRSLDFDPGRDLPFGKRGVVFRGFICPICGASVTEDQPTCTDCGAVFDQGPGKMPARSGAAAAPPPPASPAFGRAVGPPAELAPPPPSRSGAPPHHRPPPPVRAYPPAPKRIDMTNCPFCGARLGATDAFCWNCGNRMYQSGR